MFTSGLKDLFVPSCFFLQNSPEKEAQHNLETRVEFVAIVERPNSPKGDDELETHAGDTKGVTFLTVEGHPGSKGLKGSAKVKQTFLEIC